MCFLCIIDGSLSIGGNESSKKKRKIRTLIVLVGMLGVIDGGRFRRNATGRSVFPCS